LTTKAPPSAFAKKLVKAAIVLIVLYFSEFGSAIRGFCAQSAV
jgi:hypothetical protein